MICRKNRGFTFVELLVAIVIIGLILASVIPYILANLEASRRIQCAENLNTIGYALRQYQHDFRSYPRTRFDPSVAGWNSFTGADDNDPFAQTSAVKPNDVTASLWLLVRTGYSYLPNTQVFICPSSGYVADSIADATGKRVKAAQRGNFRSPKNLSYSMQTPFNSHAEFVWDDTLPSDCALLADINPGVSGLNDNVVLPTSSDQPERQASANSSNHRKAGQNVLYAGGNVQFEWNAFCGYGYQKAIPNKVAKIAGDNIYTTLKGAAGQPAAIDGPGDYSRETSPSWKYDSFLVPSDD